MSASVTTASRRVRLRTVLRFILFNSIITVLIVGLFMNRFEGRWALLIAFAWGFSISATQWGGLNYIARLIDRRYSWMETPVKKLLIEIFAFLLFSAGAFVVVQLANFSLWTDVPLHQAWPSIVNAIPYTLVLSLIISLIFFAVGFFNDWKESFIQAEKLKTEMLAYKYESLRNQINPHFLFNSLNVLSDLVYDDQKLAVKFIRQLSDLFRYVMESRDKELVALADELEFIRSYTFLLKMRFGDKLKIQTSVEPLPGDMVVPMSLQMLIENAVKHNEVSEAFPLEIFIGRKDGYIEVGNRVKPKQAGDYSAKTGLKNIVQQYRFFSDKGVVIDDSENRFRVAIPVIQKMEP